MQTPHIRLGKHYWVLSACFVALVAGGWLMLAPFALGYQNYGATWTPQAVNQFWVGLGVVLLAVAGIALTALDLRRDLRDAGILAAGVGRPPQTAPAGRPMVTTRPRPQTPYPPGMAGEAPMYAPGSYMAGRAPIPEASQMPGTASMQPAPGTVGPPQLSSTPSGRPAYQAYQGQQLSRPAQPPAAAQVAPAAPGWNAYPPPARRPPPTPSRPVFQGPQEQPPAQPAPTQSAPPGTQPPRYDFDQAMMLLAQSLAQEMAERQRGSKSEGTEEPKAMEGSGAR
jgi:hypothetical protein